MDQSYVTRIFTLLDSFTAERPELGVREISRIVHFPPSTCSRMLAILRDEGVLQQNPANKLYRLSGRVLHWAGNYRAGLPLHERALPLMRQLQERTDETVSLYLREDDHRVCINRLESGRSVRLVENIGQALDLHTGSGGRAILAFLPNDEIERILDNVEARNPGEPLDRVRIQQQLTAVRENGYAISYGEWMPEASGVGIPVFDENRIPVGSISVSGPTSRFEKEDVLNEIIFHLQPVIHALAPTSPRAAIPNNAPVSTEARHPA